MPLIVARRPEETESLWRVQRACLDKGSMEGLRREAAEVRPSATIRDFLQPHITEERRLYSQTKHWVGEPGPLLEALHESEWLRALLEDFTGKRLLPTRGAYIYYDAGGSVGLHTDVAACTASALVPISEHGADTLFVHPELVDADVEVLLRLSMLHDGYPPNGTAVRYPVDGLILIQGSTLPHHRPPCEHPVDIAALCFDTLM